MISLQNKHIILAITGGIAAYKSAELCRLLVKAGADIQVVMTDAAIQFITPLTMQALSGNRAHTALLDEQAEGGMGHIELARWADLILVAPATANFISRFNHGEASDLLTTICLATSAPIAIAPAMNQAMWSNNNTQDHILELTRKQISIFGPASGEQACGDVGPGRMLEAKQIALLTANLFLNGELAGIEVCISAGPTREAIDPVRYISNHSSGKMGYALAQAALDAGAKVTLISGPVNLEAPDQINLIKVESAEEMLEACMQHAKQVFISVAAVVDYRPEVTEQHKIKKSDPTLSLKLVKTSDILATISNQKPRPFCVGFAAETEHLEDNARTKLKEKNLDLIFANNATDTFNSEDSSALAIWNGGKLLLSLSTKAQLARKMITLISKRLPLECK